MENAKETWQIVFSGVGGQGLMLTGKLLGEAATVHEGKKAVMTSAYGVETRGTFAKSDVIISSVEIDYPEVLKADVVIALAPVAYKKYVGSLEEGAILLYDSAIEEEASKARQIRVSMAEAASGVGNPYAVNIVALGTLVKLTGLVKEQSVENAIKKEFQKNEKLAKLNIKAFNAGVSTYLTLQG